MGSPLRIRRPELLVEDSLKLVLWFFSEDSSSAGPNSYDAYIAAGSSPGNRIVLDDVRAINSTMRARSLHADWGAIISRGKLSELAAISQEWDLFLTADTDWRSGSVPTKLRLLFDALLGRGVGISRATKVLHIKRPRLIPVCDSYVLRLMGIPGDTGASAVALIEHLRSLRTELRPVLVDLQRELRKRGCERTLVRIADALVWSSYPDTWLGRAGNREMLEGRGASARIAKSAR